MPFINANTSATVWRQGGVVTQVDAHEALLRKVNEYACGKAVVGTVLRAGTGNGTIRDIDTEVNGASQTWTVTFSNATTFAVSGSVSGAQAGGTVGTNYVSNGTPLTARLQFRITAGGTAFVNGDTFTIPVTAGALSGSGHRWVQDRWSPFTAAGGGFADIRDQTSNGATGSLIFHGQGNGSEAIYQGISLVENAPSSIWNWVHRGYAGFQSSLSWDTNLSASPEAFTAFINSDMPYWICVNNRRIVVVAVASTTMHACYMGFIKPFASPQEYPYPNAVLAEEDAQTAYNTTGAGFRHAITRLTGSNGHVRDVAGVWRFGTDGSVNNTNASSWPNSSGYDGSDTIMDNHDILPSGDRQLLPILIFSKESTGGLSSNVPLELLPLGVLDGPMWVTGRSLTPQTVLSVGGVNHLSVNDIFRITLNDFWALPLA